MDRYESKCQVRVRLGGPALYKHASVKALYVYCEGASIVLHFSCFQQHSSHLALIFADVAYDLDALSAALSYRVSCVNILYIKLAGRPMFSLAAFFMQPIRVTGKTWQSVKLVV